MKIIHLDTIDSTNSFAKRILRENSLSSIDDGRLLVFADEQTAGRGRTGKTFSSLKNNGLYMSLVLPVRKAPEDTFLITPAAAAAVLEVLTEAGCEGLGIKWVNDILDDRMKKVCGILTEAISDPESGMVKNIIIGVGINAGTDLTRLPENLKDIAGSITVPYTREELAIRVAEQITHRVTEALGKENERERVLSYYRKHMILTGKKVFWEENGKVLTGIVTGITPEAHLLIETGEGRKELDSGMISVCYRQNPEGTI